MKMERRHTIVRGYRIHSVHCGSGPPVVLLHGLAGSRHWWRYTVPALRDRYEVHIPELVGFGGSRRAGPVPAIPEAAEIVVGWMEALGLGSVDLVGHSMGGQISIHCASRWPERVGRLVLVAASGIPRVLSLPRLAGLALELIPPRAWGRPGFLPTILLDAIRAGPVVLWTALRHLLADDVRVLLHDISQPTLLIWGERDALVPLEHGQLMRDSLGDARLVVIRGAAHNPMADRPTEFNAALLEFLDAGRPQQPGDAQDC